MGYSTDFHGSFDIKPELPAHLNEFFKKFNETRRMARKVDPQYGIEGEFYVNGSGSMGQGNDDNIINYNQHPKTQPGLWCQWFVQDGMIEWDEGEKFYNYEDWMYYIINRMLKPLGFVVNGAVTWTGEDSSDIGSLIVKDNVLYVAYGAHIEDDEELEFYIKKGKAKKYENEYTKMVDSLPLPEITNGLDGGNVKQLPEKTD